MLLEIFSSGPADTNTYLIGCSETKRGVVIDVPFGSVDWILTRSQALGLTLEKIFLTHSHWDHTAAVAALQDQLPLPVYIHREDVGNLQEPGSDKLPLLFPIEGVKADFFLEEGQIIKVGNLEIEVIATPGHTPGGVCFYLPKEKKIFSGDTLFQGTIGNLSFPTARPALMWESLKKLAALPPETAVYPGHGPATTIGKEQWIVHAKETFNF